MRFPIFIVSLCAAIAFNGWLNPPIANGAEAGALPWIFEIQSVGPLLWIRGEGLTASNYASHASTTIFKDGVIDIEKVNGKLFVLRRERPAGRNYSIEVMDGVSPRSIANFQAGEGETPAGLVVASDAILAVGPNAIRHFSLSSGSWRTVATHRTVDLPGRPTYGGPRKGTSYYAGYNGGEFGGDLDRIDSETGVPAIVPCGDERFWLCGPVTGIIADPWRDDCVVVSTGMIHMGLTEGGVYEVCGTKARALYGTQAHRPALPIFGLAPAKGGFWAVTQGKALWFSAATVEPDVLALDAYRHVGDLQIDDHRRDIVAVLSILNQSHSMSGLTPLLASRD